MRCTDCGANEVRVYLDQVPLCDRCTDRRIAALTGLPELPELPVPFIVEGPDGRRHELKYRAMRVATGIEVSLEEVGVAPREGYQIDVLGAHDADVAMLCAAARARAEEEIGRLWLEHSSWTGGWQLRDDELVGQLVWNEDGVPHNLIVDGRTLSWDEIGDALKSYEGWRIRLTIEDRIEDLRPDAEIVPLELPDTVMLPPSEPEPEPPKVTIAAVLADFLAEQAKRLSARTYRNYEYVIELLADCLNGYGHQYLDDRERRRLEAAYESGDEEAFVHLFGPDKIADIIDEFLGYFMIRKVAGAEELMRASGTVVKKLGKWLGERGHLDEAATADAVEQGSDAARDLPKAERLSAVLYDAAQRSRVDVSKLADDDMVDDYLMIERVEPGVLWFEGGIGPVKVPKTASALAQPGWSVNVVLARVGRSWRILEVGNVYP